MNTPNKEEILKRINGMKSICAEGRKEVISVIEAVLGQPLSTEIEVGRGDILVSNKGYRRLIAHTPGQARALISLDVEDYGELVSLEGDSSVFLMTTEQVRHHLRFHGYKRLGPAKELYQLK